MVEGNSYSVVFVHGCGLGDLVEREVKFSLAHDFPDLHEVFAVGRSAFNELLVDPAVSQGLEQDAGC